MILSFTHSSIIRHNSTKKYTFQIANNDNIHGIVEPFLKSIVNTKILVGSSIHLSTTSLSFYADSVKTLDTYLKERERKVGAKKISYNSVIHLICCLSKQQQFLESNNLSFYCLHLNDIVVIDDTIFICINPELIKELSTSAETKNITFYKPFYRDGFCSPELISLNKLPATTSFKTFYYSLGALAVFCLYDINICSEIDYSVGTGTGTNNNDDNMIDQTYFIHTKIMTILKPILYTKLYWFLLKCLSVDIHSRTLLFI